MTFPADWELRRAVQADAAAIADVNIRAWQVAYRDLLPAWYLDGLAPSPERTEAWSERIAGLAGGTDFWVLGPADTVMGYAITGPYRDGDLDPGVAELFALYVAPEAWDTGAGNLLHDAAMTSLRLHGHREAVLWTLQGNERAMAFYERKGWRTDGGRKEEPLTDDGDLVVAEVRYRVQFR